MLLSSSRRCFAPSRSEHFCLAVAPAARLGMNAHAFTVALHRLRRRPGERLRAVVAETVAESKDLDAELRHLIAAVGGGVFGR
jgi:hypothetical protein